MDLVDELDLVGTVYYIENKQQKNIQFPLRPLSPLEKIKNYILKFLKFFYTRNYMHNFPTDQIFQYHVYEFHLL